MNEENQSNSLFTKATAILDPFTKIATIGIFIIATFGYFYTVKPRFELHHLKIEKQKLESDFSELKANKNKVNNELTLLNRQTIEQKELINKSLVNKKETEHKIKNLLEELNQKELSVSLVKQEQKKLEINLENLKNRTSLLKQNIKKLSDDKNTLLYDKTSILWHNFMKQASMLPMGSICMGCDSPFESLNYKENQIFLKKDAPYLILKKHIDELSIKSFSLMDKSTLTEFKSFVLKNIEKEKNTLVHIHDSYKRKIEYEAIQKARATKIKNEIKHIKDPIKKFEKEFELEAKYLNADLKNSDKFTDEMFRLSEKINTVIRSFLKKVNTMYLNELQSHYHSSE